MFQNNRDEQMAISLEYEGNHVGYVGTRDRPEWVAKDICDLLGIKNSRQAVEDLDVDELVSPRSSVYPPCPSF